jgi:hypothetical protein
MLVDLYLLVEIDAEIDELRLLVDNTRVVGEFCVVLFRGGVAFFFWFICFFYGFS